MHILSVQPACPAGLTDSIAQASALSDVLDVVRPLAYQACCLVSLQRCRKTGVQVAVKSYTKGKLSKLAREQVDTEAYIHACLVDEHIVPLLLAAEDDRSIHLVVEWADGGDLREHIMGIGEQRLKDFVVQPLLKALANLDAQGVVHRDLKPDNVLVHQGRVRLSDFGLAVYCRTELQQAELEQAELQRGLDCQQPASTSYSEIPLNISPATTDLSLSCDSSMALSGRSSCSALDALHEPHCSLAESLGLRSPHSRSQGCLVSQRPVSSAQLMASASGTPLYTAPEVLLAMFESRSIDEVVTPKNDIWALGIMVLEALTGCHPYSPRSTCVTGSMHQCNLLYAVAHHSGFKYPSHLSPGAVDFLRAVLHTDPTQRPTATQLLAHTWLQPVSAPVSAPSACLSARRTTKEPLQGLTIRVTGGLIDPAGGSPLGLDAGSLLHNARHGSSTPGSTCKASISAMHGHSSGGARAPGKRQSAGNTEQKRKLLYIFF